jgi:hypothetical protein
MPQFRNLFAIFALVTSAARIDAQSGSTSATPLHLPASRFQFVVSGETPPPAQPLRIHNGGSARFTDVRLTRLAYADSTRGVTWLVLQSRQSSVAPDELAIVGNLCIDAAGLPAGTYRATAVVAAREVPEPVAFAVTLIVTDAGAKAKHDAGRCKNSDTK